MESGARPYDDRTEHCEQCPYCGTKSWRWHSRWPEDERQKPTTQSYECSRCNGLFVLPLHDVVRCWHCTRWCRRESTVRGRSYHSRSKPIYNVFCGRRCLAAERKEEARSYRYAHTIRYCGLKLRAALRRFLEG